MTKEVYIIDLIGTHSGMHYYHNAFCHLFRSEPNINFKVLSNYNPNGKPFFKNIFQGSKIAKLVRYFVVWLKTFVFILIHRKAYFIYHSYGQKIDVPFLKLQCLNSRRFCIDIHEVYDISTQLSQKERNKIDSLIANQLQHVIVHATKTKRTIERIGFSGKIFIVPHVPLQQIEGKYDSETLHVFKRDKTNILFFGHIRKSKGIIELFDLLNNLPPELSSHFHFVFAGKDNGNIIKKESLHLNEHISKELIIKHISDSELNFLFSHTDFIILPYLDISQSGIVEMAVAYKKPLLLSEISEFTNLLQNNPSFGHSFDINDQKSFEKALHLSISITDYYDRNELSKYLNNQSFESFVSRFKQDFLDI